MTVADIAQLTVIYESKGYDKVKGEVESLEQAGAAVEQTGKKAAQAAGGIGGASSAMSAAATAASRNATAVVRLAAAYDATAKAVAASSGAARASGAAFNKAADDLLRWIAGLERANIAATKTNVEILQMSRAFAVLSAEERAAALATATMADKLALAKTRATGIVGAIQGLGDVFKHAFGGLIAFGAVAAIAEFGRSIIDANRDMQKMLNTLNSASGSMAAAKTEFAFLADLANKLGTDLQGSADGYSRLAISARAAGISTSQLHTSFTGLSEGFAATGRSGDEMNRFLVQMEQGLSQGTIQMRDLRAMAQSFPAAFEIAGEAAKRMGGSLNDFLKNGGLPAEQFFVAFSDIVHEKFAKAAEEASNTLIGQLNRIKNALFESKTGADALAPLTAAFKAIADELNSDSGQKKIAEFVSSIVTGFKAALTAVTLFIKVLPALVAALNVLVFVVGTKMVVAIAEAIAKRAIIIGMLEAQTAATWGLVTAENAQAAAAARASAVTSGASGIGGLTPVLIGVTVALYAFLDVIDKYISITNESREATDKTVVSINEIGKSYFAMAKQIAAAGSDITKLPNLGDLLGLGGDARTKLAYVTKQIDDTKAKLEEYKSELKRDLISPGGIADALVSGLPAKISAANESLGKLQESADMLNKLLPKLDQSTQSVAMMFGDFFANAVNNAAASASRAVGPISFLKSVIEGVQNIFNSAGTASGIQLLFAKSDAMIKKNEEFTQSELDGKKTHLQLAQSLIDEANAMSRLAGISPAVSGALKDYATRLHDTAQAADNAAKKSESVESAAGKLLKSISERIQAEQLLQAEMNKSGGDVNNLTAGQKMLIKFNTELGTTYKGISAALAEYIRSQLNALITDEKVTAGKKAQLDVIKQLNDLAASANEKSDEINNQINGGSRGDDAAIKLRENAYAALAKAKADASANNVPVSPDVTRSFNVAMDAVDGLSKSLGDLGKFKMDKFIGDMTKSADFAVKFAGASQAVKTVAQTVEQARKKWDELSDSEKKGAKSLGEYLDKAKAAGVMQAAADIVDKYSQPDEFTLRANELKALGDASKNVAAQIQAAYADLQKAIVSKDNDAITSATSHLKELEDAAKSFDKTTHQIKFENLAAITGIAIQGANGLKAFAKEGTKAYAEMEVAASALAVVQAILAIIAAAAETSFFGMAAMAIAVAPLLAQLGKSISAFDAAQFTDVAKQRQDAQGAGSVLGDAAAKSESAAKAMQITADATTKLVGINRGMLIALQNLNVALGRAGVLLAQGAGNAKFPSIGGNPFSALSGDPLTKMLGTFFFGGTKKIVDEGIIIAGGTLQSMLDNIVVGAYQTVQTSGGLFGHTKTKENVQDVSSDFSKQFDLVIRSIVDAVRSGATALGLLPADIERAINEFKIAETHISLKGLSAEDQQKALEAVFSKIFDDLAGSIVPFIGKFQKVGEGLGETLVRVATEVQVMQQAVKSLGLTLNVTDPEKFAQISDGLIELVGGMDEFITSMQGFVDKFAPESFKDKLNLDALTSAFEQAGLTLPATREGMWELMQSLDASTASGQAQIATLLRLSDTADAYYNSLEKHQDDVAKALNDKIQAQNDYVSMVSSLQGELHTNPLAQKILEIAKWAGDSTAKLNQLAISAGLAGAKESDLALVQQVAASRMQAAIDALYQSSLALVNQLYGTQDVAADASTSVQNFGHAMGQAADAAKAAIDLLLGDLSPYSDRRKLDIALQGLRDGSVSQDQVLEIGRRLFSSGSDYRDLFEQVMQIGDHTGGGGGGGGGGGNKSDDNIKQIAQKTLSKAERYQLADQLANNIADLSSAQKISFEDVAAKLGLKLSDLGKDLGLDNNALQDYLKVLSSDNFGFNDLQGLIVGQVDRLLAAISKSGDAQVTPSELAPGSGKVTPPVTTLPGSSGVPSNTESAAIREEIAGMRRDISRLLIPIADNTGRTADGVVSISDRSESSAIMARTGQSRFERIMP